MDEWMSPQIVVDEAGNSSVVLDTGDVTVDMSGVSSPSDVEVVHDAVQDGSVYLDMSGDDISGVSMSFEDFKALVEGSQAVSSDDIQDEEADDGINLLAVDGSDASSSTFSPQQWQLNMAQNRPLGWHYVMSRVGTNYNHYILVLGRDIVYEDGVYRYSDCDQYDVYQTSNTGSTNRYIYSVEDSASGTIDSSQYVVYSDLFFDYVGGGGRASASLVLLFVVVIVLILIWWRGKRRT